MIKDKLENILKRSDKSDFDDSLFKYINIKNNDMFSKMSGIELLELICYLNHFYLSLRDNLHFDMNTTFGVEIECEHLKHGEYEIRNKLEYTSYSLKRDASLSNGIEVVSPILTDNTYTWKQLQKICSIVSDEAKIGFQSGGHVHVGAHVLGDKVESWFNFIKLWSVYENIIFRFCDGEFLTARPSAKKYADRVDLKFWDIYSEEKNKNISLDDLLSILSCDRYQAVNFSKVTYFTDIEQNNTIEFRCPNGTLNPVIWQNNINLLVNILSYAKNSNYNDDVVQKRKNKNKKMYKQGLSYRDIYLEQALELCDMLFTNNLDKLYFLRQYLKSFERGNRPMEKAKSFTK